MGSLINFRVRQHSDLVHRINFAIYPSLVAHAESIVVQYFGKCFSAMHTKVELKLGTDSRSWTLGTFCNSCPNDRCITFSGVSAFPVRICKMT